MRFVTLAGFLYSILFALLSFSATAKAVDINFTTENDTEYELAAIEQMVRVISVYDLDDWVLTTNIHFKSRAIPNNHDNLLTLNTRYVGDDIRLLSTFAHEQFHALEELNPVAFEAAIFELMEIYPEVPTGRPEGAKTARSSYLHLIVCMLEFHAVEQKFGRDAAIEVLEGWPFYQWIYNEVLTNYVQISDIVARNNIALP